MPRLAIIDNEKIKHISEKEHIKSLCPINRTGGDCMYLDEKQNLLVDEILCTGCGICSKAKPEAIKIINLPETSNRPPIHQYGTNGFRIFDLPLIQKGKVTGILGRNGIGKSTIINVISNTIKANFGDNEKKFEKDEEYFKYLNDLFKGTALQNHFNDLEKGNIKVAYKPQQIINIPKMFKGKVNELLEKVTSNKEKIQEITTKLNISKVIDREIEVLSGGELQRVAIAAALLKEGSNLFFFDEITNYLDIFERLNSSRLIVNETKDKTSLVVEHDLVVLDYLADFINIVYGEPGAYGMMTNIKSAKEGINIYLDGFSKDENVRFRDKPISFDKESVIEESRRVEVLAAWKENKVEVGTFKLNIDEGDIKKGEIIGIIGRNALGKSTFIKNLVEQGMGDEVYISYKPQLIPRDDTTVMEELMQFPNYSDNFYQVYILDPLRIKSILEKKTNELSGGELQRYSIAKCLLQDANLYLLDEPTAFLDIEDRLKIAKMLKNFLTLKEKSAFIIDHDLVFMDYLSDKLQVFTGNPSIEGKALTPMSMRDGMNTFLKELNITFRKDDSNKRPRVNKEGSVLDQEQKRKGEYYYN